MTQQEIIEMAKSINEDWWLDDIDLQAFAKLVAEKECEWLLGYIQEHQPSCEQMYNAIRARE